MKKKILIFIDWYKPGYKAGGPIRSISNLVNQLKDKFDFYIITRNTDYLETIPYPQIEANHWNEVDKASVYYLSKDRLQLKKIKNLILELDPDFIYCNSLYSPYFTLIPLFLSKKLNIRSIIAVRGMLSEGALGIKPFKKKLFLLLSTIFGLFSKCTFHATNESEKGDIQHSFGKRNTIVIAQNLPEKKEIPFQEKQKEVNQLKLISIARIAPEKNTLFALKALKEVKSQITFDIYGPIYSEEYWNKCKTIISQLPSNIIVNYKSTIEHEKIDETIKDYHVLFLPSTGENFGHIIIEAMINSCVPVISDKTPWRNLEMKQIGFDISLSKIELFAKKIDSLAYMNKKEFDKMSLKTYLFANKIIKDKKLPQKYMKLFQV